MNERIFISYKRKDKKSVFRIKDNIERNVGVKCWIDLNGIESDAYFVKVIMSAIENADVFIFMYSRQHGKINNIEEDWTVRELNFASKKKKKIVFINIDNSQFTDYFEMMYGLKQQIYADSDYAMNNLYADLSKWLNVDSFIRVNLDLDNKMHKLDKIKDLWSKYKISFKSRFLFVFFICIFGVCYILFKCFTSDKEVGHDYVDLGLSVKWATCNVGAIAPEEYGDYFAWGETTPKKIYNWSTYAHCSGMFSKQIKYCTNSKFGVVDNDSILNLEDDIAAVNWGGRWRMPTVEEMSELREKCDWLWTTRDGVNGYLVTSKVEGFTDSSIFLPAAGCISEDTLSLVGVYGRYWSSSLYNGRPYYAYILSFNSNLVDDSVYISRRYGRSVRPVCP